MKKLIFTSYGLTTEISRKLIGKELSKDKEIGGKRIFLFHEPYFSIESILVNACLELGFKRENIILSGQQKSNEEILNVDYLYVTEGNTFEIVSLMREKGLDTIFQKAFREGACSCYIGASAGALIASPSIEEASSFDRNFVRMEDFQGLGLFDGLVIPHYNKSELKRYIQNSPGIESKYKHIYSVSNEGILVLEV